MDELHKGSPNSGVGGRRFKSSRPDHFLRISFIRLSRPSRGWLFHFQIVRFVSGTDAQNPVQLTLKHTQPFLSGPRFYSGVLSGPGGLSCNSGSPEYALCKRGHALILDGTNSETFLSARWLCEG